MKTKMVITVAVLAWALSAPLRSGVAGKSSESSDKQSAADGFVRWGENGHFYKAVYVPKGISWTEAKAAAEQEGGYLATLTSSKENDFVFSLIDDERFWYLVVSGAGKSYRGPWIGGYQEEGAREPDGGWKWVTGEEFRYTRWASGQPNDFGTQNENRLHYYNMGNMRKYWNDRPNETPGHKIVGYIIEKEEIE